MLTGLLGSWPGIVLGAGTLLSRREYFFLSYAIVGVVHWALSFTAGSLAPRHARASRSQGHVALLVFRDLALVWGAAMALLAILNLTPLCVGQDNGDGLNTVADGIVQSTAVAVCCTPPVLGLVGLAAIGLGHCLERMRGLGSRTGN